MIGVKFADGRHYGTAACVKSYNIDDLLEGLGSKPRVRFTEPGQAGAEVDALTRKYSMEHGVSYEIAMTAVLADPRNEELKHAFAALG